MPYIQFLFVYPTINGVSAIAAFLKQLYANKFMYFDVLSSIEFRETKYNTRKFLRLEKLQIYRATTCCSGKKHDLT